MQEFWSQLTTLEWFYVVCAAAGGLLFLVRTVMMLSGFGHDADGDLFSDSGHGDTDASFKFLSIQGVTAFFMMFGLVALAVSRQTGGNAAASLPGGLAAGAATVWVLGKIFSGMKRLQSDGSIKMDNAVGLTGTVYLTIPENGTGKVQLALQGQLGVFDAAAADRHVIKTGETVKVTSVSGGQILMVEKV
jgi:membrane protein implicated in regulation of membrane protease activity